MLPRTGLIVLVLAACTLPQTAGGPAPTDSFVAVPANLAEVADAARTGSEASEHAYRLIDVIGPRMSDSPGGASARRYALDAFERYGLDRVREEPFTLLAWHRGEAGLVLTAPDAFAGREVEVLSLGQVGSFREDAPVVDAGHAVAEDFERLGDRGRGAIVLAHPGQPEGYGRWVHRSEKIALAEGAGARGFVLVAPGSLVQVGVATLGDHATEIPAVAVDYEGGSWLARVVARSPREVRARIMTENRMYRAESANVLAEIEGRSDEIVLVGAHLDSWDLATGAVDNGSGSVAVLDVARALGEHVRRTGERPLRTIRFALWKGEELGLYGSNHHVAVRDGDGRLDRYVAVLNLDVVGAPVGLGAVGRPEASTWLRGVIDALNDGGWELSEEISTAGGLYSDHMPFMLAGVPIVTLRSRLPDRAAGVSHTSADTRDKLDEEGIADSAAVSAALLWALANTRDLPLPRWAFEETGRIMEEMGFRDPLQRSGEWRWDE